MKKASETLQVTVQQLQMKNKNLRQELEEVETQLDEAEVCVISHIRYPVITASLALW